MQVDTEIDRSVASPAHLLRGSRMLFVTLLLLVLLQAGCKPWNNPYPDDDAGEAILYSSFEEKPKHLDPAVSYSANEYQFISQIYEPPFQYHYLKRPYELVPLSAARMPEVTYLDAEGQPLAPGDQDGTAYTEYVIEIQQGIRYQPHPAFVKDHQGQWLYHRLDDKQLETVRTLADFSRHDTRELIADDFIYQIKRLVHPRVHSPIAGLMKQYIVGLDQLSQAVETDFVGFRAQHGEAFFDIRSYELSGVRKIDDYHYSIRINGRYPQFRFWLAMPFFAPMPWEADQFYAQPGLIKRNITLDWYPVGTGPYYLTENNPNRRMLLEYNPNYHGETYPQEGDEGDQDAGLLDDAGKPLPFIRKVVFTLEKESIPYWNKFMQGYYDRSGISSDSFDQAVQFVGGDPQLTPQMRDKDIRLITAVTTSIYYTGFNMLDETVGGDSERSRKLRQAISIALDMEEFISIFANGRGLPAQGMLPPGIYGYQPGQAGINSWSYDWAGGRPQRKPLVVAEELLAKAGYPNGRDVHTGEPLVLYYDTVSMGTDDRARLNWYRKQFARLGIQLVIRTTDYNRFQEKMRKGNAQIFSWGWNADYPDPENFFFLLYGPNGKVQHGGENAVNYQDDEFDALFREMSVMDNSPARYALIQRMQDILREDAPVIFGFHPKGFSLYHDWFHNQKPNLMANNTLKYQKIDSALREQKRQQWNQPHVLPVLLLLGLLAILVVGAWLVYRQRMKASAL